MAGEVQGFGGGLGCTLGLRELEVAGGLVCEEDAAGLVPGGGQEGLSVGDELMGLPGFTEVEEGLAGVDGEVGLGHPGTLGGQGAAGGGSEVVFCPFSARVSEGARAARCVITLCT